MYAYFTCEDKGMFINDFTQYWVPLPHVIQCHCLANMSKYVHLGSKKNILIDIIHNLEGGGME